MIVLHSSGILKFYDLNTGKFLFYFYLNLTIQGDLLSMFAGIENSSVIFSEGQLVINNRNKLNICSFDGSYYRKSVDVLHIQEGKTEICSIPPNDLFKFISGILF